MASKRRLQSVLKVAPGLASLLAYRRDWLQVDAIAGLTVAAVLIPAALAYAALAGMPPVNGLYASFIAMLVYACFGTSRHLMVGPESGSAVLVASILALFALPDGVTYAAYAATLAVLVGILLVLGGRAKLGFLADYISKPVLVGYLNGVALIIILGQASKFLGISYEKEGFFQDVWTLLASLDQTNIPTFVLGCALVVTFMLLKHYYPKIPTALVIVGGSIVISWIFSLEEQGIKVVGEVPPGLPSFEIPAIPIGDFLALLLGAFGLAVLIFSDANIAARRSAARHDYRISADQEMVALGLNNVVTGFFQGFPVGSSQSRTLVNDTTGGKSQMVGVVAALAVVLVLLILTPLLAPLPEVALAVIVILSAIGLLDFKAVMAYFRTHWFYGVLSLVTMFGVLSIGLVAGILIAVMLSLIYVLARTARPHDAVLARVDVDGTVAYVELHENVACIVPGLVVYRFDDQLFFANSNYFEERVMGFLDQIQAPPRGLLIDASGITSIDVTAADMLDGLTTKLAARQIRVMLARLKVRAHDSLEQAGLLNRLGPESIFTSIREGIRAFEQAGESYATVAQHESDVAEDALGRG